VKKSSAIGALGLITIAGPKSDTMNPLIMTQCSPVTCSYSAPFFSISGSCCAATLTGDAFPICSEKRNCFRYNFLFPSEFLEILKHIKKYLTEHPVHARLSDLDDMPLLVVEDTRHKSPFAVYSHTMRDFDVVVSRLGFVVFVEFDALDYLKITI
jgi:hypothetical protein